MLPKMLALRRTGSWQRKQYTTEEITHKLRKADNPIGLGNTVARPASSSGVTDKTHFRWRRSPQRIADRPAQANEELESENARLKKAVAEVAERMSPTRRREAVALVRSRHRDSALRTCRALGVCRSTIRYVPQPKTP